MEYSLLEKAGLYSLTVMLCDIGDVNVSCLLYRMPPDIMSSLTDN